MNAVTQQQITVRGAVVDETNEPIIGANVMIEGTNLGTITDLDVRFVISVPPIAKLKITFIGYKDQVIAAKGGKEIRVMMETVAQQLGDEEVVAYGVQKKVSITGAISSL